MTANHAGQTGGEREVRQTQADRLLIQHNNRCAGEIADRYFDKGDDEWSDLYTDVLAAMIGELFTPPSSPVPVAGQEPWRVGRSYGIHVYEGDQPVATFHRPEDAEKAVRAHNAYRPVAGQAAREAAVEAVARWLSERDGIGPDLWPKPGYMGIRLHFADRARELLSLPEVAALSAAGGQET